MKRYLWVVEVKYRGYDWESFEAPIPNTRHICRALMASQRSWHTSQYPKFRTIKYVPQEKAK